MPRRWQSIRGCNKDQSLAFDPTTPRLQTGFDFAFPSEPAVFHETYCASKVQFSNPKFSHPARYEKEEEPLPTTSVHVKSQDPKSATTTNHSKPFAVRSDQSQYVVASQGLQDIHERVHNLLPNFKQGQSKYACKNSRSAELATRRGWRKLSEVFRPGRDGEEQFPAYHLRPLNVEEKKLGLPISRTPWRNPTSPPVVQNDFTANDNVHQTIDSIMQAKSETILSGFTLAESCPPYERDDSHPQLQVQIPLTPLERFSIMFRDVHEGSQSDLWFADKKAAAQDLSQAREKNGTTALAVPSSKRRVTSPTLLCFEGSSINVFSQGRRSSKYSLFPTTPISLKPCSTTSSPGRTRYRSVTEPAELQRSKTNEAGNGLSIISQPHQMTQDFNGLQVVSASSSNLLGLRSNDKSSSIPSESEIFFDIKSLRDSGGVESSHFEMTRPPSAAVQRVRSRSNARKVMRGNISSNEVQAHHVVQKQPSRKLSVDTSTQIEETIAIVECLTSSSATKTSSAGTAEGTGLKYQTGIMQSPKPSSSRSMPVTVCKFKPANDHVMQEISTADSATTNVKSPTWTEVSTGVGQSKSTDSASSSMVTDPSGSAQITALEGKRHGGSGADLPSCSAATSKTLEEPRTESISLRDAGTTKTRLIPLSKYAPGQVVETLARANTLRPIRPQRANTENTIHGASQKVERQNHRMPKRASSSPESLVHMSKVGSALAAPAMTVRMQGREENKPEPMMIAYVKPAAEVSIARKVSVTRKQSAKIVEPRSNVKARVSALPKGMEAVTGIQHSDEVERRRRLQVDKRLPVVQEVHHKHKPGVSVSAILDSALTRSPNPLSASVDLKLRRRLEKALPPIPIS